MDLSLLLRMAADAEPGRVGLTCDNIAIAYNKLGEREQARAFYERAAAAYAAALGPEHEETLRARERAARLA